MSLKLQSLKSILVLIYLPVLMLSYPPWSFAQKLNVTADTNRKQIYQGEDFILQVRIDGTHSPVELDLSKMKPCEIKILGPVDGTDISMNSFNIINGKATRSSFVGREYNFKITPSGTGPFTAGPICFQHKGENYVHQGPTVSVIGLEKQNYVDIQIIPSKESVLVGDPFEVNISIAIRKLPPPYSEYDPLDPGTPPNITIPFFDNSNIPGLEIPDINALLKNLLTGHPNTAGFSINDIHLQNPFPSFFDSFNREELARFALPKRPIKRNNIDYMEYSLKMTYTPLTEATHTFGPIEFKGRIISSVTEGRQGVMTPVFAVGRACTVRVIPPPQEGRPATYTGAVGYNLIAQSSLDASTCNVGDPLTLTLTISGDIGMANMQPPQLSNMTDITELFKVYEDSLETETREDSKTYRFQVRPIKEGTIEFPPVPISYFDKKEMTYKTVRTSPLPLRANKAIEVARDFIIDTAPAPTVPKNYSDSRKPLLIAPLLIPEDGCKTTGIAIDGWLMTIAPAGPAVFLFVSIVSAVARQRRKSAPETRRVKEIRQSIRMIKQAENTANTDVNKACNLLFNGFKNYLACRFHQNKEGLTPGDIQIFLSRQKVADDIVKECHSLLERNFNTVYDGSSVINPESVKADCARAIKIINLLRIK